uniref:Uncharacterized protein n=1 Tax=Sus scrofa TaxID=9823 RepID=A0A8D1HQE1_PIG
MEGVQPLDENVGNAPGRRLLRNKLLLVASVIQGLGLLLCLTYICLHLYAQVRCTTGMSFPPGHADGSLWSLGNNLTPELFTFSPFLLSNCKVWSNTLLSLFSFLFFINGSGEAQWQGHCF